MLVYQRVMFSIIDQSWIVLNHVSPDKLGAGSDRDRDITDKKLWLAVWNMTFMTFHILGRIPTDFIFFRGVETTN